MSEKLCALRKIGGGTLKETTLWTNSNPTTTQASATITLSDSVTNYDFIKFTARQSTTDSESLSIYCDATEFNTSKVLPAFFVDVANVGSYTRPIRHSTNTTVIIGSAARYNTSGSDNTKAIITSIIGMKK